MTHREITELLLDDFLDSPWVLCEAPTDSELITRQKFDTNFHILGCHHQTNTNEAHDWNYPRPISESEHEYIQGLYGLAGILGDPRNPPECVKFENKINFVRVQYKRSSKSDDDFFLQILGPSECLAQP